MSEVLLKEMLQIMSSEQGLATLSNDPAQSQALFTTLLSKTKSPQTLLEMIRHPQLPKELYCAIAAKPEVTQSGLNDLLAKTDDLHTQEMIGLTILAHNKTTDSCKMALEMLIGQNNPSEKLAQLIEQNIVQDSIYQIILDNYQPDLNLMKIIASKTTNSINLKRNMNPIPEQAENRALQVAIEKLRIRAYELIIESIQNKEQSDEGKCYSQAKSALELHSLLDKQMQKKNPDWKDMNDSVKKHEPTLKKDYYLKQILYDILNALLILYSVGKSIQTGQFKFRIFDARTENTVIVEEIEQNLSKKQARG